YLECWANVAAALFSQALAGEPELSESLPKPLGERSFGFSATLAGDLDGSFSIFLDGAVAEAPLFGEGADQKAGWNELLRETVDAAAGELLASTGRKCAVKKFEEVPPDALISRAFQLRAGDRAFAILVLDQISDRVSAPERRTAQPGEPAALGSVAPSALSPGLELLLDVELEASLRFGSREM